MAVGECCGYGEQQCYHGVEAKGEAWRGGVKDVVYAIYDKWCYEDSGIVYRHDNREC